MISAPVRRSDICFADAPVSGGPRGARDGVIAIMVGGSDPLYKILHPVLSVISCNIFHAGDVGAGHALKAGNNLLNLICRMATFEVVSLLVNAGVAPDKAVDILQKVRVVIMPLKSPCLTIFCLVKCIRVFPWL